MSDWNPDVDKLRAFDDAEWMEVERQYAGRLYAYVARRIDDRQAREDVVQEVFLGAVRGIPSFDPLFTFEQYLFGICRNRTIDHLRRRRTATLTGADEDGEDTNPLETLVSEDETPSQVLREEDLRHHGRSILADVLREWVQETWEAGEFQRLMVIEALFAGGWRNRDTWERVGLRDETAVAGIKFRALKRMRELAARKDPDGTLVPAFAQQALDGEAQTDVALLWKAGRISCPARHWLARDLAGTLEEGPAGFVRFHLEDMACPWCTANRDDLEAREGALEPLLEKVRESNARFLRSRTT
jgi:RNA polymerase sigma factor (sigma-70 family)